MTVSKVKKDFCESLELITHREQLFEEESPTVEPTEPQEGDLVCPSCEAMLTTDSLVIAEDEEGDLFSECSACGELFYLPEELVGSKESQVDEEYDVYNIEEGADPQTNIINILRQMRLEEEAADEEDNIEEAWMVRKGKLMRKKKKKRKRRTSKQKAALKKARRKAWSTKAKKGRAKSLKILRRFSEEDEYQEEDDFNEDSFMDYIDSLDEDELDEFIEELTDEEVGFIQDLVERKKRVRGGRVQYAPTKQASKMASKRFRSSPAMRAALKKARSRIKSSSRRKAVKSRKRGARMGLY